MDRPYHSQSRLKKSQKQTQKAKSKHLIPRPSLVVHVVLCSPTTTNALCTGSVGSFCSGPFGWGLPRPLALILNLVVAGDDLSVARRGRAVTRPCSGGVDVVSLRLRLRLRRGGPGGVLVVAPARSVAHVARGFRLAASATSGRPGVV